jgi:AbrB family looped-hinge helix DNA binding protein
MKAFTVTVDASGRILLPANVRRRLDLKQGSELIARLGRQTLSLRTRTAALREAQAYFSRFRPKGELWSEELIKERRKESRRERGA